MTRRSKPFCLRLPEDLALAIHTMAEQQGVNASEWVRDMIHRIVYGEPPGIEEGYQQGRRLGFRMVQLMFAELWKNLPDTSNGAEAFLKQHQE